MRISDWSSDVCSSDLQPAELGPAASRDEDAGGASDRDRRQAGGADQHDMGDDQGGEAVRHVDRPVEMGKEGGEERPGPRQGDHQKGEDGGEPRKRIAPGAVARRAPGESSGAHGRITSSRRRMPSGRPSASTTGTLWTPRAIIADSADRSDAVAGIGSPAAVPSGRVRLATVSIARSLRSRSSRPTKSLTNSSRSEEQTSELQSLMRNSYAVFCLKKKTI